MGHQILAWITHYGYGAIFCLLALGIVGLPAPDETLLAFSGYLVSRGTFILPLAWLRRWPAACAASPSAIGWGAPSGWRSSIATGATCT